MKNKSQSAQFNFLRISLIMVFGIAEIICLTMILPLFHDVTSKSIDLSYALLFIAAFLPLIILAIFLKIVSQVQLAAKDKPVSEKSKKKMLSIAKIAYLVGAIFSGGLTLIMGGSTIILLSLHQAIPRNDILLLAFFTVGFLTSFSKWKKTINQLKTA